MAWRIAKETGQKLDKNLPDSVWEWPNTVTYAVQKRIQIDSFFELPKDKRPPESIWDNSERLEKWFDDVFDRKKESSATQMVINIPEDEIE